MWIEQSYFRTREMYTVNSLNVNLRACAKPTKECPPITEIPRGSKVQVFNGVERFEQTSGRVSNWRKVEFDGRKGWVNENLLREQ